MNLGPQKGGPFRPDPCRKRAPLRHRSWRLDPEVVERLRLLAYLTGVPQVQMVRSALDAFLARPDVVAVLEEAGIDPVRSPCGP